MSMEDVLVNVLRRVIIPMFPRLSDVAVRTMGLGDLYYITFYINDRIDYQDAFLIDKEVNSVFKMIFPSKGADYTLNYKRHENYED